MHTEFDLYIRRNSWVHRLDPRVKLLIAVEATLFLFLWPTIWAAAAAILAVLALLWQARVPAAHVRRIGWIMAPLIGMVFVLTALFQGGETVLLHAGPLLIAWEGIHRGAMLALRLLGLSLVISAWLFTTEQATMVRGFRALGMPYEWGLTLALALRYLPVFAGLFVQVQEAQAARGLNLEERRFWQRLNAYRPVLVAMVISALRQSEQLGWALEARALGARGVQRTVFHPLHLRRADVAALAGLGVTLVLGVSLRLL